MPRVLAAVALVVLAAVVGADLDPRLTFAGAPPLFATWLPHVGVGTPLAVLVAVAVVVWGPDLAARLPWRGALGAGYVAAVAVPVTVRAVASEATPARCCRSWRCSPARCGPGCRRTTCSRASRRAGRAARGRPAAARRGRARVRGVPVLRAGAHGRARADRAVAAVARGRPGRGGR
ncbi:hypothetical protein [Saccharothrix yanglingensis]|uniref:hypothetical protein n=1 Tax=Saccharothrix yanglingensis TaxID=659496 RepID=UPI0027D1FED6|nr:hypothetical protein [Saccharothrix yanglingensis]